jgi:hypothetical protein
MTEENAPKISSETFEIYHKKTQKLQALVRRSIFSLAYLILAAIPVSVAVFRPGITGYYRAELEDMVYGRAYRPFVQRALVPLIVRNCTLVVPHSAKSFLQDKFNASQTIKKFQWNPEYAAEYLITMAIMYMSFIAFLLILRNFILCFLGLSASASHLAVFFIAILLPATFVYKVYIYDFPQLLLFTSCLLLLYKQSWLPFYPVYVLGCINKETTVLVPLVFLFWMGTKSLKGSVLLHFLVQLVIGIAVYLVISHIFRNNPGGGTEWHLVRNLTKPFVLGGFGKLRLLLFLLAVILPVWKLKQSPLFLKRSLLAIFPLLICLTVFFGQIDELRDYYEALPVVYTLSLAAIGIKFKTLME